MIYLKKSTKKFLPDSSCRTIHRTPGTLYMNIQLNFNSPGRDDRERVVKGRGFLVYRPVCKNILLQTCKCFSDTLKSIIVLVKWNKKEFSSCCEERQGTIFQHFVLLAISWDLFSASLSYFSGTESLPGSHKGIVLHYFCTVKQFTRLGAA